MKKNLFIYLALFLFQMVYAQKAVIEFDATEYNFGIINESDGKVVHEFSFRNKGMTPLVVSKVNASCGCTSPSWTKEPIVPGKSGKILVSFNPTGRSGVFKKTISVYSNAKDEVVNLYIRGEINAKDQPTQGSYAYNAGGVGLRGKQLQMISVVKGKTIQRTFDVKNSTNKALTVGLDNLPPYMTAIPIPATLNPDEEGKINISINTNLSGQWGPVSQDVFLSVNGQRNYSEIYRLTVNFNVVDDFSMLTLEQRRNSPILELPAKKITMGVLKPGARKTAKLKIYNKGINGLEIRRIICNNPSLAFKQKKVFVNGGKSTEIMVELNTLNMQERDYNESFTLQTNDPDNTYAIVMMSWKVKK